MMEVKFSDIQEKQRELLSNINSFESENYPNLKKFIDLPLKENRGLGFSKHQSVRKVFKDTFQEIEKNWKLSDKNIVPSGKDHYSDLKTIIKKLKQTKSQINFSKEQKEFIEIFLKYIVNTLQYEEQHRVIVDDNQIDTTIKPPGGKTRNIGGYAWHQDMKESDLAMYGLNLNDSSWKPTVADVKQGRVGDCYLLAALLSIILKKPNVIKQCFVNRGTLYKDDYVKIRFFKVNLVAEHIFPNPPKIVAKPQGKIVIKVKKSVLMQDVLLGDKRVMNLVQNQTKALWVNFIEKAFIVYKSNNCVSSKYTGNDVIKKALEKWNKSGLSVTNISGGLSFIAYTAITGECSSTQLLPNSAGKKFPINCEYSKEANQIFNFFKNNLNKTIAVATKEKDFKRRIPKGSSETIWTNKSGQLKKYAGLIGNHSYAIIENVEEKVGPMRNVETGEFDGTTGGRFKFVWLRNPHANDGFEKYEINPSKGLDRVIMAKNGGKLRMELNDFLKYFKSYDILE